MSPNNPGNFVNDLVEMASAFKRLPEIEAELEQVRRDADVAHAMTADREEAILRYKAEITELNQRIRTLEVDRDHAETMFLEADDRTSRALDFIKATFGNAGSLIQALEPPKAVEPPLEPVRPAEAMEGYPSFPAEPEGLHITQPSAAPLSGQSEPLPSSLPSVSDGPVEATSNGVNTDGSTLPSPAPEVAPAHPTSNVSTSSAEAKPELVSASVTPEADASGPVDQSFSMPAASPGRYAGRCYSEVIASGDYPNREQWEANGGTVDNWFA